MDSSPKQDVELIQLAIQKLLQENKINESSGDGDGYISVDDHNQLLLSRLMSELESIKGVDAIKQPKETTEIKELEPEKGEMVTKSDHSEQVNGDGHGAERDEILKELKKVKRQNNITHWLLSIMIVLTIGWQISEVSLILRVRDGLKHPFKSVGSMLNGILKGPGNDSQDEEKQSLSTKQHQTAVPSLVIPELPRLELPSLNLNGEK